jgi:hypothetical protein
MKFKAKPTFILFILAAVLFMAGCEKDGDIKIVNRTSYNVYAGIFDEMHTIPADSVLKVHVTTQRQSIFDSSVGRYVELFLEGETYQIWDAYLEQYVDSTFVWVNAGKTTSVYVSPNRACVKVVNQTIMNIKRIIVQRNTVYSTQTMTYELDPMLIPGSSWYKQQIPADTQNQYYYLVQVVFEDDTIYTYGDTTNILHIDDEFLVTVLPPEKQ